LNYDVKQKIRAFFEQQLKKGQMYTSGLSTRENIKDVGINITSVLTIPVSISTLGNCFTGTNHGNFNTHTAQLMKK